MLIPWQISSLEAQFYDGSLTLKGRNLFHKQEFTVTTNSLQLHNILHSGISSCMHLFDSNAFPRRSEIVMCAEEIHP